MLYVLKQNQKDNLMNSDWNKCIEFQAIYSLVSMSLSQLEWNMP